MSEAKHMGGRLSDTEVMAVLRSDTPLNRARAKFSHHAAGIENAALQRRVPGPIEVRRMEIEAAEEITRAYLGDFNEEWGTEVQNLLCDIAQILDVVKAEWEEESSWSSWDQEVRDRITESLSGRAPPFPTQTPRELLAAMWHAYSRLLFSQPGPGDLELDRRVGSYLGKTAGKAEAPNIPDVPRDLFDAADEAYRSIELLMEPVRGTYQYLLPIETYNKLRNAVLTARGAVEAATGAPQ